MGLVKNLNEARNRRASDKSQPISAETYNGGGDGGDGMLEERVANLEKDLSQVRVDIAAIKAEMPHLATKAELQAMQSSIIRWMVGTMLASAGLAASIAFGLAKLFGH